MLNNCKDVVALKDITTYVTAGNHIKTSYLNTKNSVTDNKVANHIRSPIT